MEKKSLETRLKQIEEGLPGDIDVLAVLVKRLEDMPIRSYMAGFPDETQTLKCYLKLSEEEFAGFTYREIVELVAEYYHNSETYEIGKLAMQTLAKPLSVYA